MKKHIITLAFALCAGALFAVDPAPLPPKSSDLVHREPGAADFVAATPPNILAMEKENAELRSKAEELTRQLGQAIQAATDMRGQRDNLASSLLDANNTIAHLTAERDSLRAAVTPKK